MKKLSGILSISFCFILCGLQVSAQNNRSKLSPIPTYTFQDGLSDGPSSGTVVPNAKTITRFGRDYRQASDISWYELKDHTMMSRFTLNHTTHRAFYSPRGKLIYTEFGYAAEQLDKSIYNWVKSVYYNADLVFVNEIDRPGEPSIYVIELSDDKQISKLRVEGEEMQIIRQFQKY